MSMFLSYPAAYRTYSKYNAEVYFPFADFKIHVFFYIRSNEARSSYISQIKEIVLRPNSNKLFRWNAFVPLVPTLQ